MDNILEENSGGVTTVEAPPSGKPKGSLDVGKVIDGRGKAEKEGKIRNWEEESKKMWGENENDGTLVEKADGKFFEMANDEFFRISRKLERHHSLFQKFWEIGKPVFTRTIPTAAVQFDKEGYCVNFIFNPDFWMKLDENTREFIVCHEMLHVILNHGVRIRDCKSREAANITLDIVVNHLLVNKFGFDRKKLCDDWDTKGCWVDTIFPTKEGEPKVPDDKSFEHYYNKLPKQDVMVFIRAKGGKGGKTFDDHDGLVGKEFEDMIKELDERLSDEEKQEIKDMIKKHFQSGSHEEDPDGERNPGQDDTQPDGQGQQAGDTAGGLWHFADTKQKVQKKKKWETVIKKWVRKHMKDEFKDVEQWARKHRRHMLLPSQDLMIPSEVDIEDLYEEDRKLDVWAFQDTSGSCASFADRFFKCMRTIPHGKNDPFRLHLYCFDTRVYPVDIEEGKLKGFGGTSFGIIEQYIQQKMKEENLPYPDSVWIITDGYGDPVQPKHEDRWYWFLSEQYDSYVPKKSHKFALKDFE